MQDFSLLLSIIAIVASVVTSVLWAVRYGISLGIEFVGEKETRELRKKIDDELEAEWIRSFGDFIERAVDPKKRTFERDIVADEIPRLGEAVRYTRIASTLLKVFPKIASSMVKGVIGTFAGTVVLIILVWAGVSFPEAGFGQWALLLGLPTILYVFGQGMDAVQMFRSYMFCRSQFYELSETPSLSKASDIMGELEKRKLIVA